MIHQGNYYYEGTCKLIGCPDKVTRDFNCGNSNLTTLIGSPTIVGRDFYASVNLLKNLDGLSCTIGRTFFCSLNQITTLTGVHKQVKSCQEFYCDNNEISSSILGLLLIQNCITVRALLNGPEAAKPFRILKTWLGQGPSAIFRCQKELIDNGFEEYAKL